MGGEHLYRSVDVAAATTNSNQDAARIGMTAASSWPVFAERLVHNNHQIQSRTIAPHAHHILRPLYSGLFLCPLVQQPPTADSVSRFTVSRRYPHGLLLTSCDQFGLLRPISVACPCRRGHPYRTRPTLSIPRQFFPMYRQHPAFGLRPRSRQSG